MSNDAEAYKRARAIAVTLLDIQPLHTADVIRAQAALAIQTAKAGGGGDADLEKLVADLMHAGNVVVPGSTLMSDPTDHEEWILNKRGKIDWKFWSRYQTFLRQEKQLPGKVVDSVAKLTEEILGCLEDPARSAPWDSRGMVVGNVQSGKTGNYIGLICRAIDAGYKVIIVLAGMHKNLRSQTQLRIDEGVIGRDTQQDRNLEGRGALIGVGKLFGERLITHPLTSSANNGDFRRPIAESVGVSIGSDPVIFVIKKNGPVMKNLLKWVLHVRGEHDEEKKRQVIRDVPLLVIDDEADNASINTSKKNISTINARIRALLYAFEKSAYVGYTATPFANIFVNPEAQTDEHGEDIFPRNFILNVSPPTNYVGPSRVFGLDSDADVGIEGNDALPIVRTVDDYEDDLPRKHPKDFQPPKLPASLRRALHCFVLVCAARRTRGQQDVHNSMLVHVTRFIVVQHHMVDLVREEIDFLRQRIAMGDGDRKPTALDELKELWEEEFVPASKEIRAQVPEENLPAIPWRQVAAELHEAASRIEVKEINGNAPDALDYVAHKSGFSVIAVGGDKLSRGLTLEGLSVSYFLRTSRMYDTLMQMGRWFGYRPGYLDLCRLFTTAELQQWYRHIALAEVELRREFDRMKAAGLTPRQYGLRVREHPGGMVVTAMNKMMHAQTRPLSYAGQLVQVAHFATQRATVRANFATTGHFLAALGAPTRMQKEIRLWSGVRPERVLDDLLPDFDIHQHCVRVQKSELSKFIRRQAGQGELISWTVALIGRTGDGSSFQLGGYDGTCSERSVEGADTPPPVGWREPETESASDPGLFATTKANIQSPTHQSLDLTDLLLDAVTLAELLQKREGRDGPALFNPQEQEILRQCSGAGQSLHAAALALTRLRYLPEEGETMRELKTPHGAVAREVRPAKHGLLLIYPLVPKGRDWPTHEKPFIGLAFSFPSSHTARAVDYKVNKFWRDEDED